MVGLVLFTARLKSGAGTLNSSLVRSASVEEKIIKQHIRIIILKNIILTGITDKA